MQYFVKFMLRLLRVKMKKRGLFIHRLHGILLKTDNKDNAC